MGIGLIGILLGLAGLVWLSFRGWSVLVLAPAGHEPLLEAEGVEGIEVLVGGDADAAAVSPVAAVRAAVRLALLSAERDTAVAAIAGHDLDRRLVEKHP